MTRAVGIQMGHMTGRDGSTMGQKITIETGRINEGRSFDRRTDGRTDGRDEMEEMPSVRSSHFIRRPARRPSIYPSSLGHSEIRRLKLSRGQDKCRLNVSR